MVITREEKTMATKKKGKKKGKKKNKKKTNKKKRR